MNACRMVVGRLLELDLGRGFQTTDEVDALANDLTALIRTTAPGRRLVLVVDWRSYQLSSAVVADRMATTMQRNIPTFERNAWLHSGVHPTAVLQLFRMVQESGNPNRRLFTNADDALGWLGEILEPVECARARTFFST